MTDELRHLSEDVPSGRAWSTIGSVVGGIRDEVEPRGASLSQRAHDAWMQANGDIERRHTVGTYLRQDDGDLPTLVVYIDSRAMMQDFMTNRLLYLDRLAAFGMDLKGIDFRPSKYRVNGRPGGPMENEEERQTLPEATPEEIERVRRMTEALPESLRDAASEAVISSIRREHVGNTEN